MAALVQYDMLEDHQLSEVKADVLDTKESLRKIQKKLFASHSKVEFEVKCVQEFTEILAETVIDLMNKLENIQYKNTQYEM